MYVLIALEAYLVCNSHCWSMALIAEDTRQDYLERRYQALGLIGGGLHMLAFTPRDGAVISLRRANKRERNRYAAQAQP